MTGKIAHRQAEIYPVLPARTADTFKREIFGGNKSSSVADVPFAKNRKSPLTSEMVLELKEWKICLNRSRSSIKLHLEKRVSQIFMQAVVCYGGGFIFREGHTIHQGLSAHHIPLGGKKEVLKFEAAHSATIPCLYAYSEETKEETVFLYRSGFYDESNATDDLLKAVNEADSAIDWMDKQNSLRKKTVKLLNKASKGELSPEEVSKQFAVQLIETIDQAHQKAKKSEVQDILQLYRGKAELLRAYVKLPEHIDRWLDLDLEDPLLKAFTATVDRLKQGAPIDRAEILQLIKSKIDQLPVIINQERHQKLNESRAPAHFYDIFFLKLLKKFNKKDLRLIEEATGTKLGTLSQKAQQFKNTGTAKSILSENAAKIDKVVAELQPLLSCLKGKAKETDLLTTLSDEKKDSLRPGVYRLRYEIIQQDQEAQSIIKSKIESIWHQIQGTDKGAYLEDFFQHSILAHATDKKTRQRFCKLLCISGAEIEQNVQEIKVNRTAHSALQEYSHPISRLAARILTVPSEVTKKEIENLLQQITSSRNAKSIDILFYRRLFNFADTPKKKAQMVQLIGRTEKSVNQEIAEKSTTPKAEVSIKNQDKKIKEIMAVATEALEKLQAQTHQFRSKLLVELRLSHGMTQVYFAAIYNQRFSEYSSMSGPKMSDLETEKKPIVETIIDQFSSIFGVARGLFNPSHFAE